MGDQGMRATAPPIPPVAPMTRAVRLGLPSELEAFMVLFLFLRSDGTMTPEPGYENCIYLLFRYIFSYASTRTQVGSCCERSLEVVRDGSLSGAARRLGLTQPTVGRHVDALEVALGLPLFTRSPRGLIPTSAALDLVPHAESMAAASAALRRAASGEAATDRGTVNGYNSERDHRMRSLAEHPFGASGADILTSNWNSLSTIETKTCCGARRISPCE